MPRKIKAVAAGEDCENGYGQEEIKKEKRGAKIKKMERKNKKNWTERGDIF
jgi:hypothetical protein